MDREKVINGLRSIKTYFASHAIEATDDYVKLAFYESQKDIDDALTMLKEQEAVKPTILYYPFGRRRAWCGKCGYRVKIGYHGDCTENFCGKCGTPILWEGRLRGNENQNRKETDSPSH